jgi:hypothetical protein
VAQEMENLKVMVVVDAMPALEKYRLKKSLTALSDDDFVVLDRFQEYIQKSDTFKKFQYKSVGENRQVILFKGRIYEVNTFSHSIELLAVSVEDVSTGIKGTDNKLQEGLRRLISNQDEKIFDICCKLAVKIKEKILEEAANIKINEFKIVKIEEE